METQHRRYVLECMPHQLTECSHCSRGLTPIFQITLFGDVGWGYQTSDEELERHLKWKENPEAFVAMRNGAKGGKNPTADPSRNWIPTIPFLSHVSDVVAETGTL